MNVIVNSDFADQVFFLIGIYLKTRDKNALYTLPAIVHKRMKYRSTKNIAPSRITCNVRQYVRNIVDLTRKRREEKREKQLYIYE